MIKTALILPKGKQANVVSKRQSKFSFMTKGYWACLTFGNELLKP